MDNFNSEEYKYYEEINQGIIRNVSNNLIVLDVGCGFGALGEAVKKKGDNIVYGIDKSEFAINIAKQRIDKAFIADVTEINKLPEEILSSKFDLIIFSDILEHIYNPILILKEYRNLLKDEGYILISVPNIASWTVRLNLLFGRFNYTDTGILDKTHIRFFTIKSIKEVVRNSEYEVVKVDSTPNIVRIFLPFVKKVMVKKNNSVINPKAIIDSPYYKFYLKYVFPVELHITRLWKNLLSFQIIILARPIKK